MREGAEESLGLSEQGVPLMTAQEIKQMRDEEVIGFHRRLPPFKARRLDWRSFPLLAQRKLLPPPQLSALPELEEKPLDRAGQKPEPVSSWQLTPELLRRWSPPPSSNGFRKQGFPEKIDL
jgi:type IV secretory pathway TraG/TraD family ATPase VirD4